MGFEGNILRLSLYLWVMALDIQSMAMYKNYKNSLIPLSDFSVLLLIGKFKYLGRFFFFFFLWKATPPKTVHICKWDYGNCNPAALAAKTCFVCFALVQ